MALWSKFPVMALVYNEHSSVPNMCTNTFYPNRVTLVNKVWCGKY